MNAEVKNVLIVGTAWLYWRKWAAILDSEGLADGGIKGKNGREEFSLERERRGWHLFYGGAGCWAEAGPLNGPWLWTHWAGVFHAASQQVGRSARTFQ